MKAHRILSLTCLATACATVSTPAESPLTDPPVIISVPKDLEGTSEPWKGLHFQTIDRTQAQEDILPGVHSTANTIVDFFAVKFLEATPGQLTTSICRGEQHDDGHRYGSCVFYDARLAITEEPTQFRLVITPFRVRTEQGRNAIFIPIALPKVTVADWYRYVSTQSVAAHHKLTSKYGPESIKGNFDRRLSRSSDQDREADAALRQFKDTYVIEEKDGTTTRVGAAFYPYRDGALVELYLLGATRGQKSATSLDWAATMAAVKTKLDAIAND
jgi:hypothetical protein